MRARLAALEDIPPGIAKLFWVEGLPVVLVKDGEEVHALYGICSHQKKPLDGGTVWKGVLDCPWHHFQWDIRTGENLFPKPIYPLARMPHLRDQVRSLPAYPVQVVEGFVEVEIEMKEPG
jgi:3-phenylpropionate/trans-cinnamate dioxygenase ferredoxin component